MLIKAESAEIILLLFTSNLVETPHNCGEKKLMPNTKFVYICLSFDNLRASLCKILISSFAHKMDFAHNFSVDFF